MSSSIEKIRDFFLSFPGIGSRQAERFVYFLLGKDDQYIEEFVSAVRALRDEMKQCAVCFSFHEKRASSRESEDLNAPCVLCADSSREPRLILVEKNSDFENIKKSGMYGGYYFILGMLAPLSKKEISPAFSSRMNHLRKTIEYHVEHARIGEIIIALSVNPYGDYTTAYIIKNLEPVIKKYSLKISKLGRGLSTGTELEYSDEETLKNALENRR